MTPLEIAKANLLKEEEKKNPKPPCMDCPEGERVKDTLYCGVDGKLTEKSLCQDLSIYVAVLVKS